MIFGIDVSHHQGGSLNFQSLRDAGIEFAFVKATEGASFVDSRFYDNLRRAHDAGLLVAAYHYVRGGALADVQVMLITNVVPHDVPVILDVEAGSGDVVLIRQLIDQLHRRGYRVPLLYLPRWYWQQLGQPDLRGLPPLWSSRYPDNVVGDLAAEWTRVPSHYWDGYGGLDVAVLQFTSSARIAGVAPLDANAFRGTREELNALLNGENEMFDDADRTALHVAAWRLVTLLRLEDRVPDRPDVPEPVRGEVIPLVAAIKQLRADVDELQARPVADVDEVALASTLAPLLGPLIPAGATPTQVEEVVREVFRDAGTADD